MAIPPTRVYAPPDCSIGPVENHFERSIISNYGRVGLRIVFTEFSCARYTDELRKQNTRRWVSRSSEPTVFEYFVVP